MTLIEYRILNIEELIKLSRKLLLGKGNNSPPVCELMEKVEFQ
jgi:hypothetical protein